jgi:ERF superfamily
MGAALTYARRYALFTLVGIAGEDDIDAPDLKAPMPPASAAAKPTPARHSRLNGGQRIGRGRIIVSNPARMILDAEASATLRRRLMDEVKEITSSDDAAVWAHRILAAKNSLTEADARQVEDAFRAKVAALEDVNIPSAPQRSPSGLAQHPLRAAVAADAKAIDKSGLSHPEPRRVRDREHIKFVAKQACLICGRRPADAHHLRFAQHRALGRKVSDEFTVPLCRGHHREAHRSGDEAAWWKKVGLDPPPPPAHCGWRPIPSRRFRFWGTSIDRPRPVSA